jgi:glycosyltransferase involved in cell wall biosynthesis
MTAGSGREGMVELSVVVPAFNEANDLEALTKILAPPLNAIVGAGHWQFVIVDNGSVDDTLKIAHRIAETWPTTKVAQLPRPDYGEALFHGLDAAEGSWAYIINVDFWDEPMLAWCWRHRGLYDLVLGSKRSDPSLNQQYRYRKLLSWGLNSILQFVFGFVGSDTHGQKFLNLSAMRPIFEQCVMRRGQFDTEFTLRAMRAGLWLAEVPVPLTEIRPPRNLMLAKIYRNIVDIQRLRRVIHTQAPVRKPIRYHRWAREDILGRGSLQAEVFLEAAERQRMLTAYGKTG